MTATVPTPRIPTTPARSATPRATNAGTASADATQLIIIESSRLDGGTPLRAGRTGGVLRAVVSAIGIVIVCLMAVVFTFFWAVATLIGNAVGLGRSRRSSTTNRPTGRTPGAEQHASGDAPTSTAPSPIA